MNPNIEIGFFIGLLLWGMWIYQIKTGKLLNGRWRIWTTEKENPIVLDDSERAGIRHFIGHDSADS
jgi:hypothetical protein